MSRHSAALASHRQREQIQDDELRGETLRGRNCLFLASDGGQRSIGFSCHGGVGVVGDGDRRQAARLAFAQSSERVCGLAGLRDHDDARILQRVCRAVAVLAGVFDIDGESGKVFEHDLACESGVATRSASGDYDSLVAAKRVGDGGEGFRIERAVGDVVADGGGESFRLLIDLTQHGVREVARIERLRHGRPQVHRECAALFSRIVTCMYN